MICETEVLYLQPKLYLIF